MPASSARDDLGDMEQTPSDLLTVCDYDTMTAMLAPRPGVTHLQRERRLLFPDQPRQAGGLRSGPTCLRSFRDGRQLPILQQHETRHSQLRRGQSQPVLQVHSDPFRLAQHSRGGAKATSTVATTSFSPKINFASGSRRGNKPCWGSPGNAPGPDRETPDAQDSGSKEKTSSTTGAGH